MNHPNKFIKFEGVSLPIEDGDNVYYIENMHGYIHEITGEIIFDQNTDSANRYAKEMDLIVEKNRKMRIK